MPEFLSMVRQHTCIRTHEITKDSNNYYYRIYCILNALIKFTSILYVLCGSLLCYNVTFKN